jgi:molybdopterin molybdotransferase
MNVHGLGADASQGGVVLTKGTAIDGAKLAVLASVGTQYALVKKLPRAICISTGNELVSPDSTPLPHQIRASNTYMLQGYLRQKGIKAQVEHLPDSMAILEQGIEKAIDNHDIVILSGGVSKGKVDFVPSVLQKLGVRQVFHSIAQRPGKPMWFGAKGRTLVFGLPGNPVSSLHCYLRYIQPILPVARPPILRLELGQSIQVKANLTLFAPVVVTEVGYKSLLFAHATNGSGDFVQTAQCHGFVELPQGEGPFMPGNSYRFYPIG